MSASKTSHSDKNSLGVKIKAHRSYRKLDGTPKGLNMIYYDGKEN